MDFSNQGLGLKGSGKANTLVFLGDLKIILSVHSWLSFNPTFDLAQEQFNRSR